MTGRQLRERESKFEKERAEDVKKGEDTVSQTEQKNVFLRHGLIHR